MHRPATTSPSDRLSSATSGWAGLAMLLCSAGLRRAANLNMFYQSWMSSMRDVQEREDRFIREPPAVSAAQRTMTQLGSFKRCMAMWHSFPGMLSAVNGTALVEHYQQ